MKGIVKKILMESGFAILTKPVILEYLEDHEKDAADYMADDNPRTDQASSAIGKVFGDKTRIRIPIHKTAVYDPDVEDHLTKHGYTDIDFHAGTVSDPKNKRTGMGIGKALSVTKASKDLLDDYSETRKHLGRNAEDMEVVVSHHPHDVYGMTTNNQCWGDESCMNFQTGSNRHYLDEEHRHGTHVAFLVKKGDGLHHDGSEGADIKSPYSRIALKPYHETQYSAEDRGIEHDQETAHTIFRAVPKAYGNGGESFAHTVNHWADTNYPVAGTHYKINPDVYSDVAGTKKRFYNNESLEAHMKDTSSHYLNIDSDEHFNNALDIAAKYKDVDRSAHADMIDRIASSAHGKLHPKTINRIMDQIPMLTNSGLSGSTYQYASRKHISRAVGEVMGDLDHLPNGVISSSKFPYSAVPSLPVHKLSSLHPNNIDSNVVDRVIDNYHSGASGSYYDYGDTLRKAPAKSITPQHFEKMMQLEQPHEKILNAPAITNEMRVNAAISHKNPRTILRDSNKINFSENELSHVGSRVSVTGDYLWKHVKPEQYDHVAKLAMDETPSGRIPGFPENAKGEHFSEETIGRMASNDLPQFHHNFDLSHRVIAKQIENLDNHPGRESTDHESPEYNDYEKKLVMTHENLESHLHKFHPEENDGIDRSSYDEKMRKSDQTGELVDGMSAHNDHYAQQDLRRHLENHRESFNLD